MSKKPILVDFDEKPNLSFIGLIMSFLDPYIDTKSQGFFYFKTFLQMAFIIWGCYYVYSTREGAPPPA